MQLYSTENSEEPVAGFSDLHINLAFCAPLRGNSMFLPPIFAVPLSDGSIYTASEAPRDQKP
jgi:hypothetical protein